MLKMIALQVKISGGMFWARTKCSMKNSVFLAFVCVVEKLARQGSKQMFLGICSANEIFRGECFWREGNA
jgi:hypothetical protein